MKVTVIASTQVEDNFEGTEYVPHTQHAGVNAMDEIAEFAGRSCYLSWQRPRPQTATNEGYHANTLSQGHYSIYEHATIVLYVEEVSRALTHELIRHRHLSYSQLSQRFVDESNNDYIVPPLFEFNQPVKDLLHESHDMATQGYEMLVERAQEAGATRKQAREAARAVLPNMQETKIVVSGNIRAWREVITKRNDPAADQEIQEFARIVLAILRVYAPNSVQDMEE